MVRYVSLWNWTEQGIGNITGTVERAESFARTAEQAGAQVKQFLWTVGKYDGLIVLEAADETTAVAALATLAKLGNVRTHSLRAFDAGEMRQIVAKVK